MDWAEGVSYYVGQYCYITNPSSSVTNLFKVLSYTFNTSSGNAEVRVGSELTNPSRGTVTGITAANPVVVTSVGHGLVDGQPIRFSDVGGMTELNYVTGNPYYVKTVDLDSFEVYTTGIMNQDGVTWATSNNSNGLNGSAFTAWTAGGTYNADKDLLVAGVLTNATVKIFQDLILLVMVLELSQFLM